MKDNLLSSTQSGGSRLNQNATSLNCNISEKKNILTKSSLTDVHGSNNNTGLPDNLKTGIENLSGYSMDDVKVHYNSSQPARLQAHAYAQGADIHLAPGREKDLAHEAWHVVQQKQGIVKPSLQIPASGKAKIGINNDPALEHEADILGQRALLMEAKGQAAPGIQGARTSDAPIQMEVSIKGKGTYLELKSLLDDLREHMRDNKLGKNITPKLKSEVESDFNLLTDLPFDTIGAYYDNLKARIGGSGKGKGKAKKPTHGDADYVFTPQTSGRTFDCMEGVKKVNSKTDNKITWAHIGLEREEAKQNACGANNMAYVKSLGGTKVDTIDKEKLHTSMSEGQMAGSFIATNLLDSSKLKSEMTELQLVYGVGDKGKEQLLMGGNTDKGNEKFRSFIGTGTLSDMYRSKYRDENETEYLKGLEELYSQSTDFKKEVDSGNKKKKRRRSEERPGGQEFRKRRKLRNAMKEKPTEKAKSSYGDMELIIPDNPFDKHTETNILHYAETKAIEVQQAIGTKVPCLSCFAAFCKSKKAGTLLPGFGYLWFSESSIRQHLIDGVNAEKFSAQDAVKFLEFLEKCLVEYLQKNVVHRYDGHMGDIKPKFSDDDSGSEGEDFYEEFVKSKMQS